MDKKYIFNNKTKFSKEHDLNLVCIIKCLKGEYKQHKGWVFKILNV